MKTGMKIFGIVVVIAICITAFAAAMTYVVMSLWNWLMPDLFSLTTITFWQALGLLVLSRILFGSFKFGKGRCCGSHGHHSGGGWFKNKMRKRFEGKLENMTPEEREKFRKNFLWSCCPSNDKGSCDDKDAAPAEENK